jgi:hypothetical protein
MSSGYRAQPPLPAEPPTVVPLRTKRIIYFAVALVYSPIALLFLYAFIGTLANPTPRIIPFGLGALLGILGVGLTLHSAFKVPTRVLVWQGHGRVTIACGAQRIEIAPAQVRDVVVAPRGYDGYRPRVPLQTLVALTTTGEEIELLPKIAAMPHDLAPARDAVARLLLQRP